MAEDHFRTALALNRDDAVTHRGYAALLMAQQRYFKAWDSIQQALALRPNAEQIRAEAQTIKERLHQFERVEEELAYAVWLSRRKAPKRIASACEAFDRALELDPNSIVVLKEYAIFLEHQGELVRARNMLERALEIVPEDQKIQDILRGLSPSVLPSEPSPPLEDVLRGLLPSVPPDELPPPPPETEAPKSLLERLIDFVRRSVRRQS
jgi:tetratricopeptide (TPR) repeat protein